MAKLKIIYKKFALIALLISYIAICAISLQIALEKNLEDIDGNLKDVVEKNVEYQSKSFRSYSANGELDKMCSVYSDEKEYIDRQNEIETNYVA